MASDLSGYFNDGYVVLACFDGDDYSGSPRIYYYDYGAGSKNNSIDWNTRFFFKNFNDWLVATKEESLSYKKETAE